MAFETNAVGVDVSLWQPNVDWAALKQAGVTFAFAKASEGDNVTDPQFAKNWPAMKAAGIVRGAYHFYRPGKDALKQAALFAGTAKLEAGDLPLALDLESSGGLAAAPLTQSIQTCLAEIERLSGQRPIIYTGPNFWNTSVAAPNPPAWTANYPLWIANYTTALTPSIPKGWTKWTFWQYTDKGKLNGVAGSLDMDRFSGTVADLLAWVGASPQPLRVTPPDQPQPDQPPADDSTGPTLTDLLNTYAAALNARDFDGLAALYLPTGVRTSPEGTAQGAADIRAWYQRWLTAKFPGGSFTLGAPSRVASTSWSFTWTCHSTQGDGQGQDTLALQGGQIQYHTTSY